MLTNILSERLAAQSLFVYIFYIKFFIETCVCLFVLRSSPVSFPPWGNSRKGTKLLVDSLTFELCDFIIVALRKCREAWR